MNSQSIPKLTIIAGPNGSGKSTLTRNIQYSSQETNIPPTQDFEL